MTRRYAIKTTAILAMAASTLQSSRAQSIIDGRFQGRTAALVNFRSATNEVCLTINDFSFEALAKIRQGLVDSNSLAKAIDSGESKPEGKDQQGNWGSVSEGFRLSLRFTTTESKRGQPITATVLVRNVSQQDLEFDRLMTDWDFQFRVSDNFGHLLKDVNPAEPGFLGHKTFPLYPRTQRKYIIRLDPHFVFEKGEYSISVKTRVPKLEGLGTSEIASDTASVKIIPAEAETHSNTPPGNH
jgi:hypothetical protein